MFFSNSPLVQVLAKSVVVAKPQGAQARRVVQTRAVENKVRFPHARYLLVVLGICRAEISDVQYPKLG